MWVSVGLRVVVIGWVMFIKGEETVEEGKKAVCLEAQDGRRKSREREEEGTSRREAEPGMEVVKKKELTQEGSSSGNPS